MSAASLVRSEDGSVTAEFAVLVPAVLVVLALCLGAVGAASMQVRAVDAAADGARSLARGEGMGEAAARVGRVLPGASTAGGTDGEYACVTVTVADAARWLPVEASSCALDGGR